MPIKVPLPQMVDLALGTPEVGAVNFNVLHALLHAMLKKLSITDVTAEMNELDLLSRQRSGLSDLDSGVSTGKGDESEDGMSEAGRTPYHQLEQKVARLTIQMEQLSSIPSNSDLLDRSDRPISEMWQYMQLKKKVDANTDGIDKLASLVDDLMRRMDELKKANKDILSRIDGLNMDDFLSRLKDLENSMKDLNDKFSTLPTMDDLSQFVTWPGLEDALNGVKKDWENLQPPERVVIEMSSQTEPTRFKKQKKRLTLEASRPPSSRPGTRMSTASSGPSESLLEILERLGKLSESHEALERRVEELEEQLKNKVDKSDLENLNLSSDLLEQLNQLKADLDALQQAREKYGSTAIKFFKNRKRSSLAPLSESDASGTDSSETDAEGQNSQELLAEPNRQELHGIALDALSQKVQILEDRLKVFQEMMMEDSAYQSDVTDLRSWLTNMENRPDPFAELETVASDKDVSSKSSSAEVVTKTPTPPPERKKVKSPQKTEKDEKKEATASKSEEESLHKNMKYDTDIMNVFSQPQDEKVEPIGEDVAGLVAGAELATANNRIRTLAVILNDQLRGVRDKIFTLDHDLKRMARGVEFALLRAKVAGMNELRMDSLEYSLKEVDEIKLKLSQQNDTLMADDKRATLGSTELGHYVSDDDSDALSRAQAAILQLQADFEKLHNTTQDMIEENENRNKQIEELFKYCDRLNDIKADKEYVQMEVDVKADKRSLDNKVNHGLFDTTTAEINKMIKEILDKLSGYEDNFNTTCHKLNEDIDGKLDRLELDPLKEWLENRLKALNEKLKRHQIQGDWSEDDAAGIRKQLIQKFHCISCDRPVDLVPTGPVPSLPTNTGLAPTRSPRPYTTFELDQIRQHAKRMYVGTDRPGARGSLAKNYINFERALAEKQLAGIRKSDLRAFFVHFGHDIETFKKQREGAFANPEISDYYATNRSCGGGHTTTFPNKRITRLTHLSHLFREDEETIYPIYKEEVDVQGADGHIYKGRVEKLEAKLTNMARSQDYKPQMRTSTPPPVNQAGQRMMPQPTPKLQRPRSAHPSQSPRPSSSKHGSRPLSARGSSSRQGTPAPDSSHTTPVPSEVPPDQGDTHIEVPTTGEN